MIHLCSQCGEEVEVVEGMILCAECGYEEAEYDNRASVCYIACIGMENPQEAIEGLKLSLLSALDNSTNEMERNSFRDTLKKAGVEL